MKRARGFTLVQLAIALVVLGLVTSIVWGVKAYLDGVDKRGFERGQQDVQAKWNKANATAEAEAKARRLGVDRALADADIAKGAAEDRAAATDQRWKEAVRESSRKGTALASCAPPGVTEPARADATAGGTGLSPPGTADRGDSAVRAVPLFSPEFVRQYDAAWTGLDGEPVFEAAPGGEGAAGAGAPWVAAEEVRDIHGENARRCSIDRREFAALIARIKAASSAFQFVVAP